jgi:glycosyltransferase involved in cell wall biosynthesis
VFSIGYAEAAQQETSVFDGWSADMKNPWLVSVVVPFYNPGFFLSDAIESVFAQTYDDWELLLIDDGSIDRSTDVARGWADRHGPRVRYLCHPGRRNRGVSASRNLGWRSANGGLVAFLDADDVWLPDKLNEQIELLRAHPSAGMVVGATRYWYGWTGRSTDAVRDHIVAVGSHDWADVRRLDGDELCEPPALLLNLYPLGIGAAPSMSSLIVRRSVLAEVGGFEDRFRGLFEDQAFLVKVYATAAVYVSRRTCDLYRQHSSSCCARMDAMQYALTRARFLIWLTHYARGSSWSGRTEELLARARRELIPLLARGVKARLLGFRTERRKGPV